MRRTILLLLCAAALLTLCACDLQNRRPSSEFVPEQTQTEPTLIEPTVTEPPTDEPAETSAPELVIRDVYMKSGVYTDRFGTRFEYSYRLPYFDAATEFAAGCNDQVERQFRRQLDAQLTAMDQTEPLTVIQADYNTRLRGDVLTVYLSMTPVEGEPVRAVFTIDRKTAAAVPGPVLIRTAGLTEEQFGELAEQAIRTAFEAEYGTQTDDLRYIAALDRTMAEDNYGPDMPMYLDEDDSLTILATVYDLAGGTHVVPLKLE